MLRNCVAPRQRCTMQSSNSERERNVLSNDALNTFYLRYMASDIWLRTILIVRKETRCRHIGYSYRLTARVLLYAPSHRQDSTYHGLCYTSRGALAGTRNSSMVIKFNDDGTFHNRKRSGRPRKTMPREARSMRQIGMCSPKSSCKTIRAILRLKDTAVTSSTV